MHKYLLVQARYEWVRTAYVFGSRWGKISTCVSNTNDKAMHFSFKASRSEAGAQLLLTCLNCKPSSRLPMACWAVSWSLSWFVGCRTTHTHHAFLKAVVPDQSPVTRRQFLSRSDRSTFCACKVLWANEGPRSSGGGETDTREDTMEILRAEAATLREEMT